MASEIQGIMFDMDGVLIDARDWHYEALNRALSLFGLEISRYDHLITYDGLPTKRKLEMLSRERALPPALHEFISRMKQIYTLQIIHSRCKPRFSHEYALSRLHKEGYKIAVCSNSVRQTIELMMAQACLLPYLDLILSNEDVTKSKPDPEMYIKGAASLGLRPEQCLVIEDNPKGIEAALASGAHLLQVRGVDDVTYWAVRDRIVSIETGRPQALTAKLVVVGDDTTSTAPLGAGAVFRRGNIGAGHD